MGSFCVFVTEQRVYTAGAWRWAGATLQLPDVRHAGRQSSALQLRAALVSTLADK